VFSSCGQYIHIAALEGFRPDPKALAKAKQDGAPLPPLHVALLLATYQLSVKKTTRSPPKLIHVVRVNLKEVKGIDTKQLPFSFTWTQEYLYLTASWKMLHVGRIHLFRQEAKEAKEAEELDDDEYAEDSQPVLGPEKVVFLPYTCKHRYVQFFPSKPSESTGEDSTGSQSPAKVIIGYDASVLAVPTSKPRTEHSCDTLQLLGVEVFRPTLSFEDPVICYLDEKKDLGEWIDSRARAKITKGSGSGQLYKRMDGAEMFNPEDDCDRELHRASPRGHFTDGAPWSYSRAVLFLKSGYILGTHVQVVISSKFVSRKRRYVIITFEVRPIKTI
jgi:hypothetical protein